MRPSVFHTDGGCRREHKNEPAHRLIYIIGGKSAVVGLLAVMGAFDMV
jgi:hypothetical protein